MKIEDVAFFYRGERVNITELKHSNWVEMEATALSNIKRYGGLIPQACSVAIHCTNVSSLVFHWTKDYKLAWLALHHEIEEAFGIGDITHYTKAFIFQDSKERYNQYKQFLIDELGLEGIDNSIIKKADVVVGSLEAEAFGCQADYQYSPIHTVDVLESIDEERDHIFLPTLKKDSGYARFLQYDYHYRNQLAREESVL